MIKISLIAIAAFALLVLTVKFFIWLDKLSELGQLIFNEISVPPLEIDIFNRSVTYKKIKIHVNTYEMSCIVWYKNKEGNWLEISDLTNVDKLRIRRKCYREIKQHTEKIAANRIARAIRDIKSSEKESLIQ